MSQAGTEVNSLPVLGMRSWTLRSTGAFARREPTPAQRRTEKGLLFANMLGRSGRTSGEPPLSASGTSPTAGAITGSNGGAPPFASLLDAAARRMGLDRALLAAVVEVESAFNSQAVSKAGAKGLTQLMSSTALSLGVVDVFDPSQNLLGGARFLRSLLDRYGGSLPLALAAYNAGPGAVDRFGGIPPFAETQVYVPRVLSALQRYRQTPWGQGRMGD